MTIKVSLKKSPKRSLHLTDPFIKCKFQAVEHCKRGDLPLQLESNQFEICETFAIPAKSDPKNIQAALQGA